jgi:hypothetical protein
VHYVLGLARNARLEATIADELATATAAADCAATGAAARVYKDFRYQTQKSWTQARRVVGKAEQLPARRIRGSW